MSLNITAAPLKPTAAIEYSIYEVPKYRQRTRVYREVGALIIKRIVGEWCQHKKVRNIFQSIQKVFQIVRKLSRVS